MPRTRLHRANSKPYRYSDWSVEKAAFLSTSVIADCVVEPKTYHPAPQHPVSTGTHVHGLHSRRLDANLCIESTTVLDQPGKVISVRLSG